MVWGAKVRLEIVLETVRRENALGNYILHVEVASTGETVQLAQQLYW